ncbi:MAG: sialate O-acetylesterase [Weeksellaceae bacterium]|nr:sialate O-acetylesterase [Bacteroidota bacterium]MCG2780169.1 sialate O-acetylesterase [Weeksellaceae bacterium]
MKQKITILLLIFCVKLFTANVSVPYFFSDNMVLQRGAKIPVWGFAKPNEKVSVAFKNQIKTTVADTSGNWKVLLNEEKFGGPFELKITGENEIILKNIVVGDVWLCSGQSNMEWNLARSEGFQNELSQQNFPLIRHIKINKSINTFPQKNIEQTEWKVADASTIGDFSGVAYFFAKKMFRETKVPIGLINSSWGGTNIETWIPGEGFENSDDFKNMISKMPKISVDSLLNLSSASKIANIEKNQKIKIKDFNGLEFLKNNFDETNLAEIKQPKAWEEQGYEGLDGTVWLRKTINLTQQDLDEDAKLYLSKIDDDDATYFNGIQVGTNSGYDVNRIYEIPKNLLKIGNNVIVIKVTDNGGGGGIWGEPENLKLITSKNTLSLAGNWKISVEKILNKISENEFPGLVYNAMIAPLVPFQIKGILWYQGESNIDRAVEYKKSFPLLINSWREKFGKDLPFYFVQLATFTISGNNSNEGNSWAELREAQTHTLKVKNTGMVVTTDIGNPGDIHPANKKSVGDRLADLALKNGNISPVFNDFKIQKNKISVGFKPDLNLKTSDDSSIVKGFEIAGNDQIFYPATAKLVKNRVVVSCENVKNPVAVRFGWKGDASEINLFTEKNLPVSPFRTDDFPLTTKDVSYQINLK